MMMSVSVFSHPSTYPFSMGISISLLRSLPAEERFLTYELYSKSAPPFSFLGHLHQASATLRQSFESELSCYLPVLPRHPGTRWMERLFASVCFCLAVFFSIFFLFTIARISSFFLTETLVYLLRMRASSPIGLTLSCNQT